MKNLATEFKNRTVFITGADGFVGSHLTEKMVEWGADVRVFIRAASSGELKNIAHLLKRIRVYRGDLTDKHSENLKPSWYGESIGLYEGDTLVVDTIGLNDRTFVDGFGTPHTKELHVIERFHLTDGGKVLEANVRIEDPGAFTTPWEARQRYRRIEVGPMGESTCAEGNFNYFNLDVDPLPQEDKQVF